MHRSFHQAMKDYFGLLPGQTVLQFGAELKDSVTTRSSTSREACAPSASTVRPRSSVRPSRNSRRRSVARSVTRSVPGERGFGSDRIMQVRVRRMRDVATVCKSALASGRRSLPTPDEPIRTAEYDVAELSMMARRRLLSLPIITARPTSRTLGFGLFHRGVLKALRSFPSMQRSRANQCLSWARDGLGRAGRLFSLTKYQATANLDARAVLSRSASQGWPASSPFRIHGRVNNDGTLYSAGTLARSTRAITRSIWRSTPRTLTILPDAVSFRSNPAEGARRRPWPSYALDAWSTAAPTTAFQ